MGLKGGQRWVPSPLPPTGFSEDDMGDTIRIVHHGFPDGYVINTDEFVASTMTPFDLAEPEPVATGTVPIDAIAPKRVRKPKAVDEGPEAA